MGIQANTLTHIQEIYFDLLDLLRGESYQALGYSTRNEMFEDHKTKLERIEAEFKSSIGWDQD